MSALCSVYRLRSHFSEWRVGGPISKTKQANSMPIGAEVTLIANVEAPGCYELTGKATTPTLHPCPRNATKDPDSIGGK